MTAAELRAALASLGWTQRRLAEETGRTLRAAQGWCLGEAKVPALVARLVMDQMPRGSRRRGDRG